MFNLHKTNTDHLSHGWIFFPQSVLKVMFDEKKTNLLTDHVAFRPNRLLHNSTPVQAFGSVHFVHRHSHRKTISV